MNSRCCLLTQLGRCSRKKPCCSFLLFYGACFRAAVLSVKEKLKVKCKGFFSSGGCARLACFTKPPVIISMEEQSKGLRSRDQIDIVKKDNSISSDFWSSSTYEMDHSAVQSQRSISSVAISNSNQLSDPQSSSGNQINSPEFINHGVLLWNQVREHWVGNRSPQSQTQARQPRISWNATYESLLGTNKPFPQPIPLREMVDFLVDIWDEEGLYD